LPSQRRPSCSSDHALCLHAARAGLHPALQQGFRLRVLQSADVESLAVNKHSKRSHWDGSDCRLKCARPNLNGIHLRGTAND
jgi:hypothetical protein